jgi:magnesium-transporting ATPase (P-type)
MKGEAAVENRSTADHSPGLSEAEAHRRFASNGPNELPPTKRRPLVLDFVLRCGEPLNAILLLASVLTVVVLDEIAQGIGIGIVGIANALMSAALERRADNAATALAMMVSPKARVERDGAIRRVSAREVVVGDIVHLAGGDRVPADARLLGAQQFVVDESLLTGESLPVPKSAASTEGGDGSDPVYSGTLVTGGTAHGVVIGIGADTRIGAIAGLLHGPKPTTPLQRSLQHLTARLGVASVGIGIAAAVISYIRDDTTAHRLGDAVLVGVALAVAAIPEGLPTAVTSALAFSGLRLARRGAIVRSLTALEGLGRTTVLCTDKTGTLTTGRLDMVELISDDPDALWLCALRCNDAARTGDAIDVAIERAAPHDLRADSDRLGVRIKTDPFDPARRMMRTWHRRQGHVGGPEDVESSKGAPERVLALCVPTAETAAFAATAEQLARDGHRVLAFAERPAVPNEVPFVALGLIAFGDPLRPSAKEAVAAARRAGIRVVMVTGDHPGTARAIAAAVGIPAEPLITGHELDALAASERDARLAEASIVARVDPAIKLELVRALHRGGHVVAMTGDGVNDAPALRTADIGIAVGGTEATDVARAAAAVVLRDGDLGTVVSALKQGRRIRANLQATVTYLLTGNVSEILVIIGAFLVLPSLATPLHAVHLLWINLMTDTVPALALGVDASPLNDDQRAAANDFLDRRTWVLIAVRAILLAGAVLASTIGLHGDDSHIRTQLVGSLVACHLMLAFVARGRGTAWASGWAKSAPLVGAVGGGLVLQALVSTIPAFRRALEIEPLSAATVGRVVLAAAAFVIICALTSSRRVSSVEPSL